MSENMDSIAATLGKLAKALQDGSAGNLADSNSLKTMNDKLNLIVNLLNRNLIVKLEKIEQYVDSRAKELGIKTGVKKAEKPSPSIESKPGTTEAPAPSTVSSGDLPKPSIPAPTPPPTPTPSVKPPTDDVPPPVGKAPAAVTPPASKPAMNQLKGQLGDLERQITDLEFQYKSGFVDDSEYEEKKKDLSEKRENVIKQIGIG